MEHAFPKKKDKNDDSQNSELVDKQKPIMINFNVMWSLH